MSDLIFSIDPGSIRTGWALMKAPEELIRAGLLLPDRKTDPSESRIGQMCEGLWTLLNFWLPRTILVEWTSGKVGRRHGSGGGAGLAVLGAATGSIWRECVAWVRYQPPQNQLVTNVHLIRENIWTRGVPKADRIDAVVSAYPEYKAADDKGGDIADAISLNIWYQREQLLRAAELVGTRGMK
ncbi:hypothetical protein ES703_28937 [subsurface metagenome]